MNETKNTRIQVMAALVSGLLASGHYTSTESGEPDLFRIDHGKNWKEDGFSRRVVLPVVEDAELLLSNIENAVEELEASEREFAP